MRRSLVEQLAVVAARFRRLPLADAAVVIGLLALAVALRTVLLDFKSLDYFASLKPWYNAIKDGGFSVFATDFSTYNPPYLYLLYLIARFLPEAEPVIAVKLPSLVADFVCAALVYMLVRKHSDRGAAYAAVAAFAVLFAPSVVLNSAFWGQADSLFTAGLLACVYFLMDDRPGPAMASFAISLAFKLQAVFLAPVLAALLLTGKFSWKSFLYIPAILFVAIIPAWAAGRPLGQLLNIYTYQASQFEFITMNAPTLYAWLPGTKRVFNLMFVPGVLMGAAAAFLWFFVVFKSRRPINGRLLLEVSLVSLLVVPLFLPKMHERYFYPADVLSIAFAFLYPAYFYVPLLVGGISFLSYQPFLFERDLVPLPALTLALTAVTAILTHHTLRQLFTSSDPPGAADTAVAAVGAVDANPQEDES